MTAAASAAPLPQPTTPATRPPRSGFTFTDPGCRSDVRLGALLALAAVFGWLWAGPQMASRIYLIGAPLLLWGVPWQAWQARRDGRPGFPWKLGLAMTALGLAMWPDLRYRTAIDGPVDVQPIAPLIASAGAWILFWWPLARTGRRGIEPSTAARSAGWA